MFWSLVFVAFFVAFVHLTWKVWKWSFKLSYVPSMRNFPWVGSAPYIKNGGQVWKQLVTNMGECYDRHFKLWIGPTPFVISGDAEFLSPILRSTQLTNKSVIYEIIEQFFGKSVLTTNGEEWKRRRHIVTPAFHFSILKEYALVFEKHALEMNRRLASMTSKPFEAQEFFKEVTLRIMCETAMGIQVDDDSMAYNEYFVAIEEQKKILMYRFKRPWLHPRFIFERTAMGATFLHNRDIQNHFMKNVIEQKIKQRNPDMPCRSFLDILLDVYQKNEINVDDMKGEVNTFLFAGHDTTSSALSWILYLLGLNPTIQDKLYEEIQENHNNSKDIFERYGKVEYLDMVIKESMRMYAPAPLVSRKNKIDCAVKRGTQVGICINMVHHNPKYWPDPEVFDPERFDSNKNKSTSHPDLFTYIPFSAGPRNCVGQKFAMWEMRVLITCLLTKFKISAVEKNVEPGWALVQTSENGIWITLQER